MCEDQSSPLPCLATPGCTWYNGTCTAATGTQCSKYTTYETCQHAHGLDNNKCAWAAEGAPYQCASYPGGREVTLPLSWWMPTPIPTSTYTPAPPADPWSPNLLCFQPRGCMEMGAAGNSGGANAWQATHRPNPCSAHTTADACPSPACTWSRDFCVPVPCADATTEAVCNATAGCRYTGTSCVQESCSAYTTGPTCETAQCEWTGGACRDAGYSCDWSTGMCYRDRFHTRHPKYAVGPDGYSFAFQWSLPPILAEACKTQSLPDCDNAKPQLDPARCATAQPVGTETPAAARTACLQARWCHGCRPQSAAPTPIPNACSDASEQCPLQPPTGPGQYVLELLQPRSQLGQTAPRALVRWTHEAVDSRAVLKYVPDGYPTGSAQCNALVEADQNPGGLQAAGESKWSAFWEPLCARAEAGWKRAATQPVRLSASDPTLGLVPGNQYALLTRLGTDQWSCSASAEGSHFASYACNFPRYFPVEMRYEDANGLPLGVDAATGAINGPAQVQHISPPPARLGTFERFLPADGPGSGGTPAPCVLTSTGDNLMGNLSCSCSFTNTAQCTGGGPTSSHTTAPSMYLDRKYPLSCGGLSRGVVWDDNMAGGVAALQLAYPKCMAYHLCALQASACNVCQFNRFMHGPYPPGGKCGGGLACQGQPEAACRDNLMCTWESPTHCLDEAWAGTSTHTVTPACYATPDYTALASACNVSELEQRLYYSVTYPLGADAAAVEATLRQWQDVATTRKIWRAAVEGGDSLVEALHPHLPDAFTYGASQEYAKPWDEATQNATFYPGSLKAGTTKAAACAAYAITQRCNSLSYSCAAMPTTFSDYTEGQLTSYVASALVHLPLRLAVQNKYDSLAWVLGNEDPWGCAHLPSCEGCCSGTPDACCRTGYCCAEKTAVCAEVTGSATESTPVAGALAALAAQAS
jgi:hypothetical protein